MDLVAQPVIAAVRTETDLRAACESACELIFVLSSRLSDVAATAARIHAVGKQMFLHLDLCEGIGNDAEGVRYAASLGVDGIITTRSATVRHAAACGLTCVQRFFMVDSHSVDTALESIRTAHPDMIEIMPGIAEKTIRKLKSRVSVPLIAGGLIDEKEEIFAALSAGADAVSTGKHALWLL